MGVGDAASSVVATAATAVGDNKVHGGDDRVGHFEVWEDLNWIMMVMVVCLIFVYINA